MIVSGIVLSISWCFLCCCACPRFAKPRAIRRRTGPLPTIYKRVYAISFFVLFVVFGAVSITGYSLGTGYYGSSLDTLRTGFESALNNTRTLLYNVIPVVVTVVTGLKATVSDSIDMAVGAVDFTVLTQNVFPPLTSMANGLDQTQANMVTLLAQGDAVSLQLNTLISLSSVLTGSLTALSNTVVDLSVTNKPITGFPGNTWVLKTAIPFSLNVGQIQQASVSTPNVSVILAPIRTSPNLSTFANTIRSIQITSLTSATAQINSASSGFKSSALPALDNIIANLTTMFLPIRDSAGSSIDSYKDTMTSFFSQADYYQSMTYIYRILFLCIYVIPIMCVFIGLGTKSPRLIKG